MAEESICRTCRHWQKHVHMGVCKRYPLPHNKSETDYCGEWAEKPAPEVSVPEPAPEPRKPGRPRKTV